MIRRILIGTAIVGLMGVGSASVALADAQSFKADPPPSPSVPGNPLDGLLGGMVGGGGVTGQPPGIGSALNSSTGGTDLLSQLGAGVTGGGTAGLGSGLSSGLSSGLATVPTSPTGFLDNFIKGLGIGDVLNSGKLPDTSGLQSSTGR